MNDLENIQQIRSQTLAILNELTSTPKPDYEIDGRKISWTEYQTRLRQTVDWCDAKLNEAAPYEFRTQATT